MPKRRVILLLAVAVALAFLGFLLAATDGHFIPQVVDLYLVCQYARAMAEGHPFHYNAGDPASTGATSLLHTSLLAVAHAVGVRGEGLVAFAILAGAVFFVASVALAMRIGTRLGGEREGLLAGGLVALGGPVVWGFLYGSDIALFMLLSLWLFERLLAGQGSLAARGTVAAATLLCLARPEGLPIAIVLGALWTIQARSVREKARAWLPTATGAALLVLNRGLTGQWLGTSVADKSLFANYGLAEGIALVSEYVVDVLRGLLLGLYPSQVPVGFARGWAALYFPPLGLLLVLLVAARPPEALRFPVRLWAGIVALVCVLVAPSVFVGVHFNRYVLWALPTLLTLVAAGLGTLTRLLARDDAALEGALFRAGAGLLLALGLLSTARFATLYGEMAGEVYRRDWAAAQWIVRAMRDGRLPRGAAMANIATSVEYLTGHRNVSLHGVTSPAFFGNRMAEREAGVFETLGRLPEAERPPYLITSAATQEANPTLQELVEDPPLYRSTSFGDEILIYRTRYDLAGKNGRLFLPGTLKAVEGLKEVDRLNVCDSRSEADHGYSFRSHLGDFRLQGAARIADYALAPPERVIDGGRVILGSESFTVHAAPGHDLVLVTRTASSASAAILRADGRQLQGVEIQEARIAASVDGEQVAQWTFRPQAGWDEQVLRIPGRYLREPTTRLTLSGRYASFHYWFYQ